MTGLGIPAEQQLELFPTLPLVLQPPRRLRRLGFELEQIEEARSILLDCRRELDRNETILAANVAEAKAVGHVSPDAYLVVVHAEDVRERGERNLREADEWFRVLERELDKAINNYLRRASRMGASTMCDGDRGV